ncbi:MAG: hypothetical protein J6S11_03525 [Bacteroidaceae bacterium]|nr:hypothetical protein [Bacteroidaceae bacterium]
MLTILFSLICILTFFIYGILYFFKIEVNNDLFFILIILMIFDTFFILLCLVTFLYNTVFRRKLPKIRVEDILSNLSNVYKPTVGTLIVTFILIFGGVELGGMFQRLHYYRCKDVLTEVPFKFTKDIWTTNGEAFSEAIRDYEKSEQRCFYFDLQWSIRHSKSQKEKKTHQILNKRFLQSKSSLHPQQILAYNLHEALLADSRDSILYYFKELHPGNIYNTDIYFERISKTRKLVTATKEQERDMASGNLKPGTGARRHGLSPRPLSQAIVNSTCFSMKEKTKMVTYIVKCFMELAKYNRCPEIYIQDFKTEIFVKSEYAYHISRIESEWAGSSYIEDLKNQLMEQMRESNEYWVGIYTPENWTQFSF